MIQASSQAAVAEALRHLERTLESLMLAIAHDTLDVEVNGARGEREARRLVADAYGAINLEMDGEPNKSVVCLGVIGVSSELHQLAGQVNLAKAALKSVCAPLQTIRARVPDPRGTGTKAMPLIRVILRAISRSDLNLLAAYRRIPLLDVTPDRIVYTRARTRSVYRKHVDEIDVLLQHSDLPAAAADRGRLRSLPSDEDHVALARDRYENVRANITQPSEPPAAPRRRLIAAELPIMYPRQPNRARPNVKFPDGPAGEALRLPRTRRSKLQPEPFLQTVPVYRYL